MKKITSILLMLVVGMTIFSGCSSSEFTSTCQSFSKVYVFNNENNKCEAVTIHCSESLNSVENSYMVIEQCQKDNGLNGTN